MPFVFMTIESTQSVDSIAADYTGALIYHGKMDDFGEEG